jgi:hypothetical protein
MDLSNNATLNQKHHRYTILENQKQKVRTTQSRRDALSGNTIGKGREKH